MEGQSIFGGKFVSEGEVRRIAESTPSRLAIPTLGRRGVKHTAKRTPRRRLIASLNPTHDAKEFTQEDAPPTATAATKAPGPLLSPVVRESATRDSTVANVGGNISTTSAPDAQQAPATESKTTARGSTPSGSRTAKPLEPNQDLPLSTKTDQVRSVIAAKERLLKAQTFDSTAFDVAIYQQPIAMKPPPGVLIPARRQERSSSSLCEERRRYIHANPAIHLSHNRSEEWHKEKAQEIQARGGRKAWFGKVVQRQRWLRDQQKRDEGLANGPGLAQRRTTPQPWTYARPLDFGDVPESRLPDDVLQNPGWLVACAWHREIQQMRALRQREIIRSEQETKQFYNNIMAGMRPVSGGP